MARISHWSRYLLNGRHLRNAIHVLIQDIGYNVQYDHYLNGNYKSVSAMKNVHALILSRIVQKIFIDSNRSSEKSFADIIETINQELIKLNETSVLLQKLATAHNSNTLTMFSDKAKIEFMGTSYSIKLEEKCIERFINKQMDVLNVLRSGLVDPVQAFPVPKNSDSSTMEYRQLIAKPKLQETILTALVASIYEHSPSVEFIKDSLPINRYIENQYVLAATITTSLFGTRYEFDGFSNYIVDYDNFKVVLSDLRKKYTNGAMRYLDIKNFFGSLSHELVSKVLWEAYRDSKFGKSRSALQGNVETTEYVDVGTEGNRRVKFKPCGFNVNSEGFKNFVSTLLKFDFIGVDGLLQKQETGLTIESHTQHAIATLVLQSLFKTVANNIVHGTSGNVDIVGYVDDIFIFTEDAASLERVNAAIERVFTANGLLFSDKKDSGILAVNEVTDTQFKELVRLPGVAYFDFAESDTDEFTTTDSVKFENRLEIIGKAKETIKSFEKIFGNNADQLVLNLIRNDNEDTSGGQELTKLQQIMSTIKKLDIIKREIAPDTVSEWASTNGTNYYKNRVFKHLFNATMHKLLVGIVTPDNKTLIKRILINAVNSYPELRTPLWGLNLDKLDRKNKSIMFIRDIVFWLNNRQEFDFTKETAQMYIDSVKLKDDSKILQALQYFYLQSTPATKYEYDIQYMYLMEFARVVVANFPSKIKFLGAVLKVNVIRWRLFTAPHVAWWQPLVKGVKDKVLFDMWKQIFLTVRGSAKHDGRLSINDPQMLKQWFINIDKNRANMVDSEIISQYYLTYRLFKFTLSM